MAAVQQNSEPKIKPTDDGDGEFKAPVLPQKIVKSEELEEQQNEEKEATNQSPQLSEFRYSEPNWAKIPTCSKDEYSIEVIKEGQVVEVIRLHTEDREKSYWAIGRFEPCEIKLEHPSVSRFHAILQYGECIKGRPGWYLFDLNSTHGVRINKQQAKKRSYIPLHSGYVLQIAGSSRLFVFAGGPKEREEPNEAKQPIVADKRGEEGAEEEKEGAEARYYEKDPLSWLERYFEREGSQMRFQFSKTQTADGGMSLDFEEETGKKKRRKHGEEGGANWVCSVELIADISLTGGHVVTVSAPSKKLAQVQCALMACERLDNACLLRISTLWNKKKNYAENDYYDSDEDEFLDRTGQIEEQRRKRRRRFEVDADGSANRAKTYDELVKELAEVDDKLAVLKKETEKLAKKEQTNGEEGDDAPKLSLSTRMAISQMKGKERKLSEEQKRLQKLVEIAKPVVHSQLPALKRALIAEKGEQLESEVKKQTVERTREEEEMEEEVKREEEDKKVSVEENVGKREGQRQMEEEPEKMAKAEKGQQSEQHQQQLGEEAEYGPSTNELWRDHEKKNRLSAEEKSAEEEEQVAQRPERVYAPALPSKSEMDRITPKFGILSKEEMVRMKLLQRQREKEAERNPVKRARTAAEEQRDEQGAPQSMMTLLDAREQYATWMPPEDDGQAKLKQKFAGRY